MFVKISFITLVLIMLPWSRDLGQMPFPLWKQIDPGEHSQPSCFPGVGPFTQEREDMPCFA